ncbi:hypothetical protein ACIRS1_27565 [Kitasatospora sp. NPDC101176]|uniref:hypothetical protein n=1 Tax=Kitasatospora sp. NPDC101176 TaxID=3364099 RepID=UPI0037FC3B90
MPLGNAFNKAFCNGHDWGYWEQYDGSFTLYGIVLGARGTPEAEHCLWFRRCRKCRGRETELRHSWGPLEFINEDLGVDSGKRYDGYRCTWCRATKPA